MFGTSVGAASEAALGAGGGSLLVAEVAQAHDGSLGMAHAFIDAVANAGADAIKFQTHIAAAESTPHEQWRVKFSYQDATRYDYWRRMEFTPDQWHGLKRHCDERGLIFLSSPFSVDAVDLLTQVGVAAWKIASGEVANTPMFERMAQTGLPILLSTGMSSLAEVDDAVARVKARGLPLTVLQCTSAYPCPPEKVGLNLIPLFRERYGCPVGLSDHSGTIYPGLAAAAIGIDVLEVHVTLSREMFGPDVCVSITTAELKQLVDGVRFTERLRACRRALGLSPYWSFRRWRIVVPASWDRSLKRFGVREVAAIVTAVEEASRGSAQMRIGVRTAQCGCDYYFDYTVGRSVVLAPSGE